MADQFKKHNDALWVFLSHSSKDYDQVRELRNIMEEKGMRPLMFFLKCLDEAPEIFNLIKREIDARERFILCDSENARASDWVQKEVEYIKSKQRAYVTINLNDPASYERQVRELKRRSQIFMSYSRNDQQIAEAIGTALRERGFNIYDASEEIPTGGDFRTTLANAIAHSAIDGYFLAIITPDYCRSSYCMKELSYAVEMGRSIIPCIACDEEAQRELWEMKNNYSLLLYTILTYYLHIIDLGEMLNDSIKKFCDEVVKEDLKRNK